MALADFQRKTRAIRFDGGEFTVRAVSLNDVAGAISRHQEAVDKIAATIRFRQMFKASNPEADVDTQITIDLIVGIIRESPYLAADIISSCSDEPDAWAIAFQLPIDIQIEALQAIGELTFADASSLKKLVANAKNLLSGILPKTVDVAA